MFVGNRGKGGEAGTEQSEIAVRLARFVGKEQAQDLDQLRVQLQNHRAQRLQLARVGDVGNVGGRGEIGRGMSRNGGRPRGLGIAD